MAIACDAASLADLARCYSGLSTTDKEAVMIYLLAKVAGEEGTSASDLAYAARSYHGLSGPMAKAVMNYLLCQIANASA